jgi:hypothetical protein
MPLIEIKNDDPPKGPIMKYFSHLKENSNYTRAKVVDQKTFFAPPTYHSNRCRDCQQQNRSFA